MTLRKPLGICYRCKVADRRKGSSYCQPCERIVRGGHRNNNVFRSSGIRRANPDACNCNTPGCNGMRCERVSA